MKKVIITPHITIYKMQINSLVSILFRVTSAIMVLLIALAILFFLSPMSLLGFLNMSYSVLAFLIILGGGILGLFVIFHLVAGILHLIKDLV